MSIRLATGLPVDADGIQISPDYRNMVQFELVLHDDGLTEQEKVSEGLLLLYPGYSGEMDDNGNPCRIPEDLEKAIQYLSWFYLRGHTPGQGGRKSSSRAYDFEQDFGMIYAAFAQAYHIRLAECEYMHWWEFMTLLEGLPDTTLMARVMRWRTVDVSRMSKDERAHVMSMRKVFALKREHEPPLSAAEIEAQTKEKVKRRMEEVMKNAGRGNGKER